MGQDPPRQELFDLYKIAVDEYRFEVKLNSDRMIHYVLANCAILSVAAGLLKIEGAPRMNIFVALVFSAGMMACQLGIQAIRKGNEYYHRTIHKKTLIEALLGFTTELRDYPGTTLAIGTTKGQTETLRILHDAQTWLAECEPKAGSVARSAIVMLRVIQVMDGMGTAATLLLLWRAPLYIPWP